MDNRRPRILLTTIHQPLGIENDTCTGHILAEMYHGQVTRAQGPFSIRVVCTGWGLDLIAANLEAPTTVLHYPTLRQLARELDRGYDFVGIGFVNCTFPKAKEICALVRKRSPRSRIILGGYGTMLPECDQYADFVCREEGVSFFKQLLGEQQPAKLTIPVIRRQFSVLSVSTGPDLVVPVGLGCSRGCDFCCTSHFFDRRTIPLIRTGKEIHDFICSVDVGDQTYRDVSIIDEDFLHDRRRAMDMERWNCQEVEKPILFSCLTSLKSISQYSEDELLSMGLSGVWVGLESRKSQYPKLKGIDVAAMIRSLKGAGISVLSSMIVGYDWHDTPSIEDDFQYLLTLRPTLTQFLVYGPCPGTPFYERLQRERRLLNRPYLEYDGFHLVFTHPHFSPEDMERLVLRLFEREHEELGPCIFRFLEVQLNGFERLRNSERPLFRRRAAEHGRMALQIYPLLRVGISQAPSSRVREYLVALKSRQESLMQIPRATRSLQYAAPILYQYTRIRESIHVGRQPRPEIHRYPGIS